MSDLAQHLTSIMPWSKAERLPTVNGIRYLRKARPTEDFWALWKENKQQLVGIGITVGKDDKGPDTGKWLVKWWQEPSIEEREQISRSLEQSNAVDSNVDINIPVPQGREYRPYQRGAIAYGLDRSGVLLADEMGLGKRLSVNTPILTPDGWVKIGTLRRGDLVIGGSTGRACDVTGVYPQGKQFLLKVTFDDDTSVFADAEHLWSVRNDNDYRRRPGHWRTMTTAAIAESLTVGEKRPGWQWEIPTVPPVWFTPGNKLPIDPYLVGVLIGNGGLMGCGVKVHTRHKEQLDLIRVMLPAGVTIKGPYPSDPYAYGLTTAKSGNPVNPLLNALRGIGLQGKRDYEKFIPREYLWASPSDRLSLLQGLMDTDGTTLGSRCRFSTSSPRLADEVIFLVRSLGGWASHRAVEPYGNGRRDCFLIVIQLPMSPFRLTYHKNRIGIRTNRVVRKIVGIEGGFTEDSVCIAVSDPGRLYVVNDFIVTHNTIEAIGIINMDHTIKKVLIVCPASLKINWYRELRNWLVRDMFIAIANTKLFPKADIVIINYDILIKHDEILHSIIWDAVIADEAHYIKKPTAQRTRVFKLIGGRRRIAATGTPIEVKIMDIFEILNWLDPKEFNNRYRFAARYCGSPRGTKVVEHRKSQLQTDLRRSVMIRRMKRDVLKELPPKQRQVIPISVPEVSGRLKDMSTSVDLRNLQVALELAKVSTSLDEYDRAAQALNGFVAESLEEMAEFRRAAAQAKLPYVTELLGQYVEAGQKVVSFAYHQFAVQAVAMNFPGSVMHYGGMSTTQRQMAVDTFQNDPNCPLFSGSISTAEGYTVTAASVAVVWEYDWRPSKMLQAEDRLHRIGQRNAVNIIYVVLDGSFDAYMAWDQVEKLRMIDAAINPEEKEALSKEISTPMDAGVQPVRTTRAEVDRQSLTIRREDLQAIICALSELAKHDLNPADMMILNALMSSGMTSRQAVLGRKLVRRYQRQLPEQLIDAALKMGT